MRSQSGSVGCEMCHLHPALFLELRFAECKGWAGFSRVPDSWEEEEEEERTGLISCSVLVCDLW